MLHVSLLEHLQQRFTDFFSSSTSIYQYKAVYGGDINRCFLLETSKGNFFIKVNASIFGLDMFEKEAMGLILLADTGAVKIPRPLFNGKFNQQIFLVIEYIDPGRPAPDFWESFGRSLAQLHYNSAPQFGLHYNNYIGKLTQSNRQHSSWNAFFSAERLFPLVHKAYEKGMLEPGHVAAAEQISGKLHTLFPEEQPSLLHGDLWNGNFIAAANGEAALFDPAVYFGSREMDMAMSLLFGGFDTRFYEAYEHHFPLQPGWRQRVALCQLYPLLVHLLLFGGSYRERVVETLGQYN
ncbi:MAG TPA: fructosamine kinase family protein [Agriterribacter sp.]|nr:fructosamine kinase family protein [Agriterribacter sp.]HRQ49212.1 fructosamine kinase family protein [Agriterribacter sp.]